MSAAPTGLHRMRVRAVVAETPDSRSLHLEVPQGQATAFAYRPGQFLTLHLPIDGRRVPRCYSMSSTPGLDEGLRVTVKRVDGGLGSNWICDHLRAGDVVEVLPPAGVFVPRALDTPFLLLAGGSGITPVFSILRAALAGGGGPIALFYANRDERSVIFAPELRRLAAEHPQRLTVTHWLDSVQGVPSAAQLQAWIARHLAPQSALPASPQAFVCGPGPFMDAAVQALESAGVPDDAVHVERFVSLPVEGEPVAGAGAAAKAGNAAAPAPAAVAFDTAQVQIHLDGQVHTVACEATETLLDAAQRQGLELPHACRAGLCASCRCRVTAGSVHLRQNDALDARDLARGWTLACQAVPTSEQVVVDFGG